MLSVIVEIVACSFVLYCAVLWYFVRWLHQNYIMAYITKRKDTWFAQIRRKDHKSLSKSFPTKTLANEWARKQEQLIDAGKYQDSRMIADVSFGTLIDDYIKEVGEKNDFGRSKLHVLNGLKKSLGKVKLPDLTQPRITEHIQQRQAAGAGGVTIAIDLTYIGTVLKAAAALWKYPVSLDAVTLARTLLHYDGISTKSKERERRPTQAELDAIFKYFDDKGIRQKVPMKDLINFAIHTAMRSGEITRIKWADLNESDKTVIIRDRKHPKEKTGNDQEVPLLGDAFDIAMRQPRTDERIFPIANGTISSLFPRACNANGIIDLRFHDLRHEGISRLFEQGYRIEEVALISGHRNIKMLFRYVQLKAKNLHRKSAADMAKDLD